MYEQEPGLGAYIGRPSRAHLPTRYEIVARFANGAELRLGFTSRANKVQLLGMAREHGEKLIALSNVTDEDALSYSSKDGWKFGDKLQVCKSGRTEREVMN